MISEEDPYEKAKIIYAVYKLQSGTIEDIENLVENMTLEDELNILRLMRAFDGQE